MMTAKSEYKERFKPTCLALAISAALCQAQVYAQAPPSFSLDSLTTGLGVTLTGKAAQDHAGTSASAAGDINDDGIGDIVIGAPLADPKLRGEAGESYVVFGGTELNSTATSKQPTTALKKIMTPCWSCLPTIS